MGKATACGKASISGGVKPMAIAGRMVNERERLIGMTDEERAWRAQWLKDQILSPNEPRKVPGMYEALHNPIRRFYRWPLDKFEKAITPSVGEIRAAYIRYFTGKGLMTVAFMYAAVYYFKYNANDWTRVSGWRTSESRCVCLPGDPGYPKVSEKNDGSDYADERRGFTYCNLNL